MASILLTIVVTDPTREDFATLESVMEAVGLLNGAPDARGVLRRLPPGQFWAVTDDAEQTLTFAASLPQILNKLYRATGVLNPGTLYNFSAPLYREGEDTPLTKEQADSLKARMHA